ncbi:MAG: phospho-N-acetylmuramoyl-pentapeptide-transferase, partial [Elusimicrobiota bacterium]|nr:phospho-N-acetylmuramoyl-pentapeptide-transferase [Elusimicrobiota bacterium]
MLYHLLYPLKIYFSPLNVVGYITFRSIAAVVTSLILSLIIGYKLVSYLKKSQITQIVRSDGPQTHQKKTGTPTMGGLIILLSLLVSTLLWARLDNRFVLWTISGILWLGVLGWLDDYIKIVRKNPVGLKPLWKLTGQVIFAVLVAA